LPQIKDYSFDTEYNTSSPEAYSEVMILSDDEDYELDENEDGTLGPDYNIKQEFPQAIHEGPEKDVLDIFLEDLMKSFSRVVGSQIHIEKPERCCSIMHAEIRFTMRNLPADIEWVDLQTHVEDAVMVSNFMMGSWVTADGDIHIHMAKDPILASLTGMASSGYSLADQSCIQTCRLTMSAHSCDNFPLHDKAIQEEYQTFAYILRANLRLNPHDTSLTLRHLSNHHVRMHDMTGTCLFFGT
jgi:hypothetical protein